MDIQNNTTSPDQTPPPDQKTATPFKVAIAALIVIVLVLIAFLVYITNSKKSALTEKATSTEATSIDTQESSRTFLADHTTYQLDGSIADWPTQTPTWKLFPASDGSPTGKILVRQIDQGILIGGDVSGKTPHWPTGEGDLMRSDHIEVWMADAQQPAQFPLIGWGNQFDNNVLASSADCEKQQGIGNPSVEDCKQWYSAQETYRKQLKKLFLRQWQFAPSVVREIYSVPAFAELNATLAKTALDTWSPEQLPTVSEKSKQGVIAREQALVAPLEPRKILPTIKTQEKSNGQGYTFEVFVPWEALPPTQRFDLQELRLLVDVFGYRADNIAVNPYATISANKKYADPDTFIAFELPNPRHYQLSACEFEKKDPQSLLWFNGVPQVSYIFPTTSTILTSFLSLMNSAAGYQYQPGNDTLSPIVDVATAWTKQIGGGRTLCGPKLALATEKGVAYSEKTEVPEANVTTKVLPDGSMLIKDGPRSYGSHYGSGQCGGCPRVTLSMLYFDPQKNTLTKAFEQGGMIDEPYDMDMVVSPDWQKIEIYNSQVDHNNESKEYEEPTVTWDRNSYCWSNMTHKFDACGVAKNVSPPSPRAFSIYPG